MATLASSALNIATMLGRVNAAGTAITDLEAEIKAEIQETIRFRNRGSSHLTEFRGMELVTVVGQVWYTAVNLTPGAGEQASGGRTMVPVSDVVTIDYARDNPGPTGLNDALSRIDYRTFESLYEGSTGASSPTYFTVYAGQIGLWPSPAEVYTLYFSGDVKPAVPLVDNATSVWLDEAAEMIEMGAAKRVCLKHLRDAGRAQEFAAMEEGARVAFQREYIMKRSAGIRSRC